MDMSIRLDGKIAIVTGASSGIGAATARALSSVGCQLALGARRGEKLEEVAAGIELETGRRPLILPLDVTSRESASAFVEQVVAKWGNIHVLINNAGLASGTSPVAEAANDDDWELMMNTNVLGLLRMSRLVVPHLIASGAGHVVNLGSTAGHEAYVGGAGYCATKFGVRAITSALRQELLGKPVRVTSVDPGMVETEFSIVRYYGDKNQADQVYAGMTPLTAEDIADCILFTVTRPFHVNIDEVIVKPTDQAGAGKVARH
jgi:3-hydroxy acid dehydrogenase / malonic semialdehyde reductase